MDRGSTKVAPRNGGMPCRRRLPAVVHETGFGMTGRIWHPAPGMGSRGHRRPSREASPHWTLSDGQVPRAGLRGHCGRHHNPRTPVQGRSRARAGRVSSASWKGIVRSILRVARTRVQLRLRRGNHRLRPPSARGAPPPARIAPAGCPARCPSFLRRPFFSAYENSAEPICVVGMNRAPRCPREAFAQAGRS